MPELTRLLAEHTRDDAAYYVSCRCGWQHIGGYPTGRRPYLEHLAEVIEAYYVDRIVHAA